MKRLAVLLTLILAASFSFAQVQQTDATLSNENKFSATNFFLNGLDPGPVTFSQLGFVYATGTTFVRCTDCQQTNPCLGSGTGAFALYVNGTWSCTQGGGTGSGFTTAAEVVAAFSGCSDADYLGADTACHVPPISTCVNALAFPGSSIVEQLQAAVTSLSGATGCVTYPPGQYTADDPSNWQSSPDTYLSSGRIGVLLGTGQSIIGPGTGSTITVNFAGNYNAALIANLNHGNLASTDNNITVSGLGCNWNTPITTPGSNPPDKLSLCTYFANASNVRVTSDLFTGNPNDMSSFLDVTNSSYDHNQCYLNTNDYFYGNACIGVARFLSPPDMTQGFSVTISDNLLEETAVYSGGTEYGASLVVGAAADIDIEHNRFLMSTTFNTSDIDYAQNAVETGTDNFGDVAARCTMNNNKVFGGNGFRPSNCIYTEIVGNYFYHSAGITVETQGSWLSGGASVGSYGLISANRLDGLGAQGGIGVASGSSNITNAANLHSWTITGNEVNDQSIVYDSYVNDGVVTDNTVRNAPVTGINCTGCLVVKGNTVINAGVTNPANTGNTGIYVNAPYGTATEVSYNSVTDNQTNYSTGTVCSVPFTFYTAGTTCMTSGTGKFLYLTGGTWSQSWTNRCIYIASTCYYVRNFFTNPTATAWWAELEDYIPFIPLGTGYSLSNTTYFPLEIAGSIGSMTSDNFFTSSTWKGGFSINCGGTTTVANYANLYSNYVATSASCPINYFVPPQPATDYLFSGTITALGSGEPDEYAVRGIYTPLHNITVTGLELAGGGVISCTTYPVIGTNYGTDTITLSNGPSFFTAVPLAHPFSVTAGDRVYPIIVTQGTGCVGNNAFPVQIVSTVSCTGSICTWESGNTFEEINNSAVGAQGIPVLINNLPYTALGGGSPTSLNISPAWGGSSANVTLYSAAWASPPDYTFQIHYTCCN